MNKEARARVRENRTINLRRLKSRGENSPAISACEAHLINGLTIKEAAKKCHVSESSVKKYLKKLEDNKVETLTSKSGAKPKMSNDIKQQLRELMKTPPFALDCGGENKYYSRYYWTQGFMSQYLLEHFGIEYTARQCRSFLNELNPYKEVIADELSKSGRKNIWLFMNIKVYAPLMTDVMNPPKKSRNHFFVCLAYRYGNFKSRSPLLYKIYSTGANYSGFIDKVFQNHIKNKAIIFLLESDSNASTRDSNMSTFVINKDKVSTVIYATINANEYYNKWLSLEHHDEWDDVSSEPHSILDYENIYSLFNKNPLYNKEGKFSDNETEDKNLLDLEDELDAFSSALFHALIRIRNKVNKVGFVKTPDKIKAVITKSFDEIWNDVNI